MSASFPEAERFYKSAAWVKASRAYRNRMSHLCERCNRPGAYVHHKTYLTPANIGNPQITLNADNFELLCFECHEKEHNRQKVKTERRKILFDSQGRPVGFKDPPPPEI